MIKALLIDDEPHANALLKTLLERYFSDILEVIATAPSIRDARLILSEQEVNLVFLDIQMPEENGFSLFNYFPEPSFDVIFTTAYDNFSIQAFKYSAFDYLLKPMDKESLNETLQRYLSKKTILRYQKEQIELLRSYINRTEEGNKRVFFNTTSGIEMPFIKDILYIKASGNYCEIYGKNFDKIVVTQSLKEVGTRLPTSRFFKIHRSHLIALDAVMRYNKKEKLVELIDGSKLEVAHREEKEFLEMFESA